VSDNDQDQRVSENGRRIRVTVYGDTADELELAALDEARKFFGEGPLLRIVDDYTAIPVRSSDDPEIVAAAAGKRRRASVLVVAVSR
jgi:hypothetical protein